MKFIKTYIMILILSYMSVFFGGLKLFDLSNHFYRTIAVIAFIISVIVSVFFSQEEKIEELSDRIKELEEKKQDK